MEKDYQNPTSGGQPKFSPYHQPPENDGQGFQYHSMPISKRNNRSGSRSHSSRSRSGSKSRSYSSSRSRSRSSSYNSEFGERGRQRDPGFERMDSNISHPRNQDSKPPVLDFLIFILKKLQPVLTEEKILHKIETQVGDVIMEFDPSFVIPDYNGCLLKIKGVSLKKKRDATQQLLEFIVKNNLGLPEENSRKYDKIEIVIMIPNGLVSMVIGTRGKQISNLINESKASIVINQPIFKMTYRTVSISGKPLNVSNAIMNIQKIMEDRYNEVAKIEFECRPLNVTIAETNVKLIVGPEVVKKINENNHYFADFLQEEYNVSTKTYQDRKNRQLERKDCICSLKGTIGHVQNAIIEITRKIKSEIRTMFDGKESYTIKMLINKIFVTKLIGAGGCMIQEIANFSKGASIKIMSNKHDEKKSSCHDIPVCIAGSFCSVQDACCIIIELMECFKNGGPVLKSGKYLHQNIAIQFINSIFTNSESPDTEEEHIYTIKDRFLSNKENLMTQNISGDEPSISHLPGGNSNIKSSNHLSTHSPPMIMPPMKVTLPKDIPKYRHHHSRKPSHSFSKHSRERERSRSYSRRRSFEKSRSKSSRRSRSRSRSSRHNDNDDRRYRKKESMKHSSSNYEVSNSSFSFQDGGEMKLNTYFIVPDHLVSLLRGTNGESVRSIMNKSGSIVTFSKEYNDDCKINTTNGTGRICNLKGTPQQNAMAMQMILELVIKYETILKEK